MDPAVYEVLVHPNWRKACCSRPTSAARVFSFRMQRTERQLLWASILFSLLGGEGVLRITGRPSQYLASSILAQGSRRTELSIDHAPEAGPQGGLYLSTARGRRLRPNVDGIIRHHYLNGRNIPIQTNSLGFRGPELELSTRPRILFLGDSITLGDYLPEEETFVRIIADTSERTGQSWQTLNAGVGSVGTDTELAILEDSLERVKSDLVVLNLYLNDVQPSPAVALIDIPRILRPSWLVQYFFQAASHIHFRLYGDDNTRIPKSDWDRWHREFRNTHSTGPGDFRTEPRAFHSLIDSSFQDWGSAWSREVDERIISTVRRMQLGTKNRGASFVVALHPVSYQVETVYLSNEPQTQFNAALNLLGIPCLDLLPVLRAAWKKDQSPLFYDQCHHTPKGSHLVADALVSFLSNHLNGEMHR